jgi:hypothetical protein
MGTRDASFDEPYVDVDEWRDEPVRHRYVHGGFRDTDTRFSLYLPPAERYEGRFFHPLMPISGTEHGAPAGYGMMADAIGFALASGGYLVESNQGRTVMFPGDDSTLVGYRASAAVARYSRQVAAEMYGDHRPYGYVYGGSGGSLKAIGCFENCPGVWDGAIPFVQGVPVSMPNMFTVQAHAIRVLRPKFDTIVDALEPGGGGDMYLGLNVEEREALAEVTRMGFPPRSWFDWKRIAMGYTGVFSSLVDNLVKWDPEYFEDFWTVAGYLGANPPASLVEARVQHKTTISQIVTASEAASRGLPVAMAARFGDSEADLPAAIRLESLPDGNVQGAGLRLTSGAASGHVLYVAGLVGDLVMTGFGEAHFRALKELQAGDEVIVDNSIYLAAQTYHRHQVPSPDYHVWDQYRVAGKPMYPQRPKLLGPQYNWNGGGCVHSGRFAGKMIVVQTLMDEAALPWQADWYRQMVAAVLGPRLDDHYRLWYVDNAMHTTPLVAPGERTPVRTTRVVSYAGVLQQALRDLADWVEKGVSPPPSTDYEVVDGQVVVPHTAAARRGIQPVVTLTANRAARAEVTVGEPVRFAATVEVPPQTGTIVSAEWDFEGDGSYPHHEDGFEDHGSAHAFARYERTHSFSQPGQYFPALRVASQRQGDPNGYGRALNLGRVRVVVS